MAPQDTSSTRSYAEGIFSPALGKERATAIHLHEFANHSGGMVLEPREFEFLLARERDLADRSNRIFCLMVLRVRDAQAEGLDQLVLKLRGRLRSTDLVGRLDYDQIGLLLSDTNTDGAQLVGDWIDSCAAELGIQMDAMIYVYPTVKEAEDLGMNAATRQDRGDGGGCDEHASRGRSSAVDDQRKPPDRLHSVRWPMADLWAEMSVPMPLGKRALDITGAALALLFLSPVLLAAAIAIKLDSPGPVIFRQTRAGRGGRPFHFYKFRSMVTDAEQKRQELAAKNEQDGPIFKMREDPRITRVGRVLRRWSIDELPQLWNILRGDMSLVGPRSPTLDEVAQYEPWQRRRLSVTGGATCIWQVSGRSQIGFRDWMRMDVRYVRSRGLWLDLSLLARTPLAIMTCRGAY